MIDLFLQSPLEMGECLSTAPETHIGANVVTTFLTPLTFLARQSDFECYSVAWLEIRHRGANSGNDSGRFMAETERFANEDVAVAEVGVVVQIAAAETC